MSFVLKKYNVDIEGYGTAEFFARNKTRAKARAFRALQSANDAITFKRFLQLCRSVEQLPMALGTGRPILVGGEPAHWVEHAGGNSVRYARPNCDNILLTHELDITEIEAA